MTNTPADADLRERFRELREHDDAAVPEFEFAPAPAPARHPHARRILVAGLAWAAVGLMATVALTTWLMLAPPPAAPDLAAVALPAWRTPTDSLLASTGAPVRRLAWSTLPTDELGRPSFNP